MVNRWLTDGGDLRLEGTAEAQPSGFAPEKRQNPGKVGLGTWAAAPVAAGLVKLTGIGARRNLGRINSLRYIAVLWLIRP